MKVLFDTSVLVAGLVAPHPAHERAFPWLVRARAQEIEGWLTSHSLAELYAVLTVLPVRPRLPPAAAMRLIRASITNGLTVAAVTEPDYWETLERLSGLGLSGGVTYDALILQVGRRLAVDRVLTFNLRDLRRAWPERADWIYEP